MGASDYPYHVPVPRSFNDAVVDALSLRHDTIATSAILRIKSIEYYQFCIECNQTSVVDWPYQLPLLGACSDSIVTAACVIDEAKLLGIARSYNYLSLLGTISMYDVVRHATPFGCS